MIGVGGGTAHLNTMRLAGLAAWVGGALSMAVGEYISVSSQRDSEEADIEKERAEQLKGPEARAHELEELKQIYVNRGLSPDLAQKVAEELTAVDVIRAHARDELGIDIDELANPLQAGVVSAVAFTMGAAFPLLGGFFINEYQTRLITTLAVSMVGLALFGAISSILGGAKYIVGTMRVLFGGLIAFIITFAAGKAFGVDMAK
jgi:VIT1/CCC1 family predicted Fe2+/Mn2+ transporter